ncbi:MAG TPA: YihY/virulence factor BrkB family protein [Gemmatimonadaceae bacterium]|nr:YihY/virulence factor BrkB family protein [Gemmatimonadaceae bacterium]
MVIKGYRVGPLLKNTGKEILDDNVLGLAAQTAYYFFFSLFPLLLFTTPLVGLLGDPEGIISWVTGQAEQFLPPDALGLVRGVVDDVVFSENAPGLISIGLVLAAWTGSNVFNNLIFALNRAYDIGESRPWWRKRLIALGAVIVAGLSLFIASTIMLAGPEIINWVVSLVSGTESTRTLWLIVQYPLAFVILVAMMWMIYYFLPNLRQSKAQVLVGAVAATVLWILVTLAFRAYVVNFGSYNKTYGTIGAVIILLTWMYLTMLVILVGGELNSELHHGTGAVKPRTNAVYAGRVVTTSEPGKASTDRIERVQPLGTSRT